MSETPDPNDPAQNNYGPLAGLDDSGGSPDVDQAQNDGEDKDAQIATLTAQLASLQAQVAPPDAVVSNQPVGGRVPDSDAGEAQFHEVPAAGTDEASGNSGVLSADSLASAVVEELSTDATVQLDTAPELSDAQHLNSDAVRNQEELREAVGEILTMVREIHETVAWVKAEAPKIGAALSDSPFGKLLPGLLNNL